MYTNIYYILFARRINVIIYLSHFGSIIIRFRLDGIAERSDSRGSAVANILPTASTKINDTMPASPRAASPRTISRSLTSITDTSAAAAAQAAAASGNNNDII